MTRPDPSCRFSVDSVGVHSLLSAQFACTGSGGSFMFCTECGTQIDQGKNFCKNCGARVGRANEPASSEPDANASPSETAAPARSPEVSPHHAQAMPASSPRENGGNNKLIIIAAGVAVVLLAAAGVYFGTDLLKPSANQTPPRVAEPIAKNTEAPPLPSFEDTKDPGTAADSSAAVKPPLSSEPMPPAPSQSQMQGAGQDAQGPGRAARPQAPIPASRGGAAAGIYETRRATTLYEEPSASAKTVATIPAGTPVNVVSSTGDWLEVHSKRGNPPGYIRRDDATFIEKSN
jgi:SH3 domain-containing protein/zinc ribbon protein